MITYFPFSWKRFYLIISYFTFTIFKSVLYILYAWSTCFFFMFSCNLSILYLILYSFLLNSFIQLFSLWTIFSHSYFCLLTAAYPLKTPCINISSSLSLHSVAIATLFQINTSWLHVFSLKTTHRMLPK